MQSPNDFDPKNFEWGKTKSRLQSVSVKLYQLNDGKLVFQETELHRAELRHHRVDSKTACDWLRARRLPIPKFVSSKSVSAAPTSSTVPRHPVTQRSIDALVILQAAFRLFGQEQSGFEFPEEFPDAVASLTHFACAVDREKIRTAGKIRCNSAQLLVVAALQAFGE